MYGHAPTLSRKKQGPRAVRQTARRGNKFDAKTSSYCRSWRIDEARRIPRRAPGAHVVRRVARNWIGPCTAVLIMSNGIRKKKSAAITYIRDHASRLVVALSGGVDSAALLYLAREALGPDNVLAVTGRSESLADQDAADSERVAMALGCPHRFVETCEMDRPEYRANAGDRCYHCRSELFDVLRGVADREGYDALAYGAIKDDVGDFRPGMAAARERRVLAPLLEAGFSKEEIRGLAREAGMDVAAKPAAACLSSRIPAGTEVTAGRLAQVAQAEQALRRIGFRLFRVRHHGEIARLELDEEGNRRIGDPEIRREVADAVREAGFRFVTVDLEGYRTGSLNPEGAEGDTLYSIKPARDGGQ